MSSDPGDSDDESAKLRARLVLYLESGLQRHRSGILACCMTMIFNTILPGGRWKAFLPRAAPNGSQSDLGCGGAFAAVARRWSGRHKIVPRPTCTAGSARELPVASKSSSSKSRPKQPILGSQVFDLSSGLSLKPATRARNEQRQKVSGLPRHPLMLRDAAVNCQF